MNPLQHKIDLTQKIFEAATKLFEDDSAAAYNWLMEEIVILLTKNPST